VWALPTLAIAVLTVLFAVPAVQPGSVPTPEQALAVLLALIAQLYGQLALLVAFAAPTALVLGGAPAKEAFRSLRTPAVLAVAAWMGLLLTFALLLTMVPGLLAGYVNALMGLIFLAVGTIGGAAAAVGLFARWMYAPALAAQGLGPGAALDRSRALAKAERNFGAALGLAVLFALVLAFAAGGGLLAERALPGGAAARVFGTWLVLWPGAALVEAKVAARLAQAGAPAPDGPQLALATRPSRCPRCDALAQVRTSGPTPVRCHGCGLAATVT
jgi:hypothetical protein